MSTVSDRRLSADDEVAEEDRPPFSEVMLSQPPTPDTAGGIEAAFARSAGFSDLLTVKREIAMEIANN